MRRGHARRATLAALALAAVMAGPSVPARACEGAPDDMTVRVEHGQFGDIGWEALEFGCEDGALVVETRLRVEVKILLATAYRREAEWREVWRGEQLIAFEGTMIDDGETFEVKARLEDDRMIIEGSAGRIEAPASVVPDHPWNGKMIERPLLFDVRDGYLLEVEARPAGEEMVALEGREILAQKYVLSGDVERELWYDRDGRLLRSRFERAGGTITMTRE